MKKVTIYFLFSAILGIASCEEEITPNPPDYYHLITGNTKKTWKITKLEWAKGGIPDAVSDLESCDRDNLYTFYSNSDRLFEVNYGNNKCFPSDEGTILTDQWSLVNATATLSIPIPIYVFPINALPFFIKKATKKEMSLVIYIDQDNLYSYTITMQSVSEE